jgi:peptidoglycan/LPS O-acetylase OafA/YrhL
VYLVHLQGMDLLGWAHPPSFGNILDWVTTMTCSLGFAYVFYLLTKKPSHQLARKIQVYGMRCPVVTGKPAFEV